MSQESRPPQPERRNIRDSWTSFLLPIALIFGLVLLLSLNTNIGSSAGSSVGTAEGNPLEGWLKLIVGYFAAGAEIAAAVVIGIAILRGMVTYLRLLVARSDTEGSSTEAVRLRLGRALTLGLEFTVASDILRTAVAPTRQDILNLGAIVLLRTLLNYFLEREIEQAEAKRV